MPDTNKWNQFSGGWRPSDDAMNGNPAALLKMDNVELDVNGALSLTGGCKVLHTYGSGNEHTLFSSFINNTRCDYSADANGHVFRDGGDYGYTGGSATNAAYCPAFNWNLMCSGSIRKKDNPGIGTVNLGVETPPQLPAIYQPLYNSPGINFNTNLIVAAEPGFGGTGIAYSTPTSGTLQLTTGSSPGAGAVQTYGLAGVPFDLTSFNSLPGQDDSTDIMPFLVDCPSPAGFVYIMFLLQPPDSSGDLPTDYFTWTSQPFSTYNNTSGLFLSKTQTFLTPTRGEFVRYGSDSTKNWGTVYGIRIVIYDPSGVFSGTSTTFQFSTFAGGFFYFISQRNAFAGEIDYVQVNVGLNLGAYLAKSAASPITSLQIPTNAPTGYLAAGTGIIGASVIYTPTTPTDPQVQQVWIFRRGGTLDQWYRVNVITYSGGTLGPVQDTTTDLQALSTDIILNTRLISVQDIPGDIFDIIGPIEGRWFYFTSSYIYPSDINNPDLVDPSISVRSVNGSSEVYLWARKSGDAAICVGTSVDVALLTGTFITLPDFSVDIYYRKLGCKYPPITCDASFAEGAIFYLAADGWRSIGADGTNRLLVATATDELYRGVTRYGYSVNSLIAIASVRFPVVVAKNKLWCAIHGQHRIEVFDFARAVWRNLSYSGSDITSIASTSDGRVIAYFADGKLREIDCHDTYQIDGSAGQTVNILSVAQNFGTPDRRKDLYTLKVRANTGGSNLAISLITDTGATINLGNVNTNSLIEVDLDVSQALAISKWVQFVASGTFTALLLDDLALYCDTRPVPLTFLRLYNTNFGNASKKRLRVWPLVIDTRGGTVTFTPFNDNSAGATTAISTSEKTTVRVFYKTDIFAVDYGGTLFWDGTTPFEFWEAMTPDIVQVLPIARQFDQVGPEELFRYGRIKQMEVRMLSAGGGIPYTIYFNDNSVQQDTIPFVSGKEESHFIGLPQGIGGGIVRIEFGPTSFDFHRFYVRLQVMKSGRDTELEWVSLPDPDGGQ